MILVDVNLLIYANNSSASEQEVSQSWLAAAFAGPSLVRFAWPTLWAFLRISTNPRAFKHALPMNEAEDIVASWLAQPTVGVLEPGERHWDILRRLNRDGQAIGPLVTDAVLAAIAIEHGATLCTTDRDFARFEGLRWVNPLTSKP